MNLVSAFHDMRVSFYRLAKAMGTDADGVEAHLDEAREHVIKEAVRVGELHARDAHKDGPHAIFLDDDLGLFHHHHREANKSHLAAVKADLKKIIGVKSVTQSHKQPPEDSEEIYSAAAARYAEPPKSRRRGTVLKSHGHCSGDCDGDCPTCAANEACVCENGICCQGGRCWPAKSAWVEAVRRENGQGYRTKMLA